MFLDIARLEETIADVRGLVRMGLIATDIWDRETGLSLAGYDSRPDQAALLNEVATELARALDGANLPPLGSYFLADLADNRVVVVQPHGRDLMSAMLLDARRTNLGVLITLVIPRYAAGVAAARPQHP